MLEFSKYNKIAGIYKWENKINHKCYIGQSINLGSRLRHHVNNFKHNRYDAPLYRAFNKYGIDSFSVEILYSIENPTDNVKPFLDRLEVGFIEKYNSYGKTGYNQTRGGDAGILGYKFTEEQRRKTSENSKRSAVQFYVEVFLFDMDTQEEFHFPSVMSAAKHFNCSHSQITRVCRWQLLTLNKSIVGSLDRSALQDRVKYVKEYSPFYTNASGRQRKCPAPGLTRHFNTPDGKKIIPKEQREKIRNTLYKYAIELYKDTELVKTYKNTKEINDDLFKYKDVASALKSIQKYTKEGWKYKGVYTFKLIQIR